MRPILLLPLVMLCALAAYAGLRLRAPDVGDAIARVAQVHERARPGAAKDACAAAPGTGEAWLIVACGPEVRTVYRLDRRGRILGWQTMDGPDAGL